MNKRTIGIVAVVATIASAVAIATAPVTNVIAPRGNESATMEAANVVRDINRTRIAMEKSREELESGIREYKHVFIGIVNGDSK